MRFRIVAAGALLAVALSAQADDIDPKLLSGQQHEFRLLSEDLGAVVSYKPVAPGEPLGTLGFDIGLEATATDLQNTTAYRIATGSNDAPDYLWVPKLHVHKGLPFRFDVDAFYSTVPSTNIKLFGGAIGYSLLEGGAVTPALTLRATASKVTGVDDLSFRTTGVELTMSKGFAIFTPYAGIGHEWISSKPTGLAAVALNDEKFGLFKVYVGLNINLGLVNLAFEGDKTGDAPSYSGKVGFRF